MASTYELIASTTVGSGGASAITFSSIPSTYTDLSILISGRSNRSTSYLDDLVIKFNGLTTNKSGIILYTDNGTSASSTSYPDVAFITGDTATSNVFANISVYIPNYLSSNYKSWSGDAVTENNATGVGMGLNAGLWSSTSTITSMEFGLNSSRTFLQYTTAYLYGIKNS